MSNVQGYLQSGVSVKNLKGIDPYVFYILGIVKYKIFSQYEYSYFLLQLFSIYWVRLDYRNSNIGFFFGGGGHCTELSFGAVTVKIIDLSKTGTRDFFDIILHQKNPQELHLLPKSCYRVFKLDMSKTKQLLGHQKCTFKS